MNIEEESVEGLWKEALKYILENGKDFKDKDNRICREVMNLSLKVNNLKDVSKPIELLSEFDRWMYPPLEELENFILNKKEIPGYYYNYGARAFNFTGIDQINKFVIPLLKKDSTSRRASVIFYNPVKDSSLVRKDIPGMIMANFNIRNGRLNATTTIRSNDLFFGWPSNIYQIYTLLNYIGEKLNYPLGSITTFSISAHIFQDQFEDIKKVVK